MRYSPVTVGLAIVLVCSAASAQPAPAKAPAPATPPAPAPARANGKLPFIQVDAKARQVRVQCEAIHNEEALEFFCCSTGGSEHESVLRSRAKPSDLHLALLMLGLTPGEPVRFSEAANKWLAPHGPPVQISAEFEKDGKLINVPGYRLMKDFATKAEAPPFTWIFVGSHLTEDNRYAADLSGYLVSVVNFDSTVIDVPELASSANESLQWVTNVQLLPATGTKVTMIIEPAGRIVAPTTRAGAHAPADAGAPEGQAPAGDQAPAAARIDQQLVKISAAGKIEWNGKEIAADALARQLKTLPQPGRVIVAVATPIEQNPSAREVINALSAANIPFQMKPQSLAGETAGAGPATGAETTAPAGIAEAEAAAKRLRQQWQASVAPHAQALRDAARTHNQVIAGLRAEQQRLIDEADRIQRVIDELEKKYQDLTTPSAQ
jgi:hypothetical protein